MNLLKQSKVDLMDHIAAMQKEVDRLQSQSDNRLLKIEFTEKMLQRALGYIDCINEDKDNNITTKSQDTYNPQSFVEVKSRGPNLQDIAYTS